MAVGERLLPSLFESTYRNGQLVKRSPSEIKGAGTAGAKASQTITLGGTPDAGDSVTVSIRGRSLTLMLSAAQATTLTTAAVALAAAINADPTLNRMVYATAAVAVVTVTANNPGAMMNSAAVASVGVGITATAGDTTMAGGTGNVITPLEDGAIHWNGVLLNFRAGQPIIADASLQAAVIASGIDAA